MYHFLVNRAAGNGRGQSAWTQVQPVLDERKIPYRVSYPEDSNDAIQHIHSLSPSVSTLVVVGGDGTIQSVLTAVVGRQLKFGLIPAGSGNDVARALRISFDPKAAVAQLLDGAVKPVDVVVHDGKCYATAIGIGFDGAIAFAANESWYKKWLNRLHLGRLTYVFALLQVVFRYQPANITLTIDGKSEHLSKVWLIAIANFPSYGGGMKICPQAKWNDGLLEICVVRNVSRMELLRVFPKVYSGRHTTHPAIHMYQGKSVTVRSDVELMAHGDGELVGTTPLTVAMHTAQLKLVVPNSEAVAAAAEQNPVETPPIY